MNTRKDERIENEIRYLKRRVSYLESFITCHPDLAFLIDENGRYVDILTSCEGQLYKNARDLIGKKLGEVLPGNIGAEAVEIIHKTLITGESQIYEYMLDVPDGLHWFEGRTSRLTTEDGSSYVIWVARNITERKKIEQELLRQKAVVATAIESLPFEFWVFDKNRECILQNSQAMSLLGDCTGKNLFDLPLRRERLELVDREIEAILSGSNMQIETSRKNSNEDEHSLLIGAPVMVKGDAIGATGIKIDITKQKRYENTLSRIQRIESLGLLAGGIAHDFNNLLMGVMGNISLAMMNTEPGSGRNEHLAESVKLIEEAKHLTSQLLTFARGGAPKRKTVLLQELIPLWVRFASSGSSADINITIEHDTPPVSIDTDQFSQVINNLIINAIQAGGRDVRVNIDARPVTDGDACNVFITVSDNGPGIPEDIKDKIFDPYYSTKAGGTGLGLTICHSIVTQHGGEIYTSPDRESGTSFIIKLPAENEEPEHIAAAAEHRVICGSGDILVLDDDEAIGKLLERFLKKTGYTPVIAKNSMEAVAKYKEASEAGCRFTAVLLDLTIPGDCGGVECLRMLKEIDPQTRAVVMSGYAENRALADYRELGFYGSLEKPFTLESLSSILASIINQTA